MDIEKKPMLEQARLATEPTFTSTVKRQPDGAYEGWLYVTFQGQTLGHMQVRANNQECLKLLCNSFAAIVRSQPPDIIRPVTH